MKRLVLLLTFIPLNYISEHLLSNYLSQLQSFDNLSFSSAVFAQSIQPNKVAQQFYQAIPDFPKENNYTSKETNEIATENTLVSRLVRYHQYIKARPTIFRLDWKLTLADYLGKNEIMNEQRYPGYSSLTQNPFKKDKEIISNLTMKQRNNLVQVLVSIYNPNYQNTTTQSPTEKISPSSTENQTSPSFELPQPGGADLLLP